MTQRRLPSHVRPVNEPFRDLDQRAYELERRLGQAPSTRLMPQVFSYPGPLTLNVESPPWYPELAIVLQAIRISILFPASGTVTVAVNKTGGALTSISLPGGQLTLQQTLGVLMNPSDYLTVKTTAVSDAANVSVGFMVAFD